MARTARAGSERGMGSFTFRCIAIAPTIIDCRKVSSSAQRSVEWKLSSTLPRFMYRPSARKSVISAVSQSAMREVVGQTRAQAILTTGKNTVEAQVIEITQKLLDEYGAGVTVSSVNLGDVQPPREVADAFAEVVRAGQNQQQSINEAEQYRNQKYRLTDGDAAKLIEDANAYKAATVAEAQGADEAFITSASAFVLPVVEIDGVALGGGAPGPVATRLREIYLDESRKAAV